MGIADNIDVNIAAHSDGVDASDTHAEALDVFLHKVLSSNGEDMRELGGVGEVLTR